jgi:hypothetical protein
MKGIKGLVLVDGKPLGVREEIWQLPHVLWPVYFFFVRLKHRSKLIPKGLLPMVALVKLQCGDIVVTGKNDVEYVGNGKFLLVSKEDGIKLHRGIRIITHLKRGVQNQLIIRKGKIVAIK